MSAKMVNALKLRGMDIKRQRESNERYMREVFHNVEFYGDHMLNKLVLFEMVSPDYVRELRTEKGDTLLHYAAKCGKPTVVLTLLAMGADAEAKNFEGKTPAEVACTRLWAQGGTFTEIDKLRHEYYRDEIRGCEGSTALFGACQDPGFGLYAQISDIFKAAEAVRAQAAEAVRAQAAEANIVAHVEVPVDPGGSLDLEAMYTRLNLHCTYQKNMFPGLIYRPHASPVVLLCFCSGKIVITGGKTERDVMEGWRRLWPTLRVFVRAGEPQRKRARADEGAACANSVQASK